MKKLLLLGPIAVLALASCSNDEQIAQSPALNAQELTIRPVVEGATRTVITDADFAEFTLEATMDGSYKFLKGNGTDIPTSDSNAGTAASLTGKAKKVNGKWETVDKDNAGADAKWYWESKNAKASFLGYNASGDITVDETKTQIDQKDVLVAYNYGQASTFENGVPMFFRHVMSQIVIKADNKDADIRVIKVAGIRLHNIGNKNTLTLPNSETTADKFKWFDGTDGYKPWANDPAISTRTKYTYYKKELNGGEVNTNGGYVTLNPTAQDITFGGALLLLPQNVAAATDLSTEGAENKAYFDVLIQVQNSEADQTSAAAAIFPKATSATDQKFAWAAVPVEIAWKPGYKYTYIFHFSKDGIGKVSPDGGEGGVEEPVNPGEEILDSPVPLTFTVIIDEWNDAANTEKDL